MAEVFRVDKSDTLAAELRAKFDRFHLRHQAFDLNEYHLRYVHKSSVLFPLVYRDGDYYVILTKRSKDMAVHANHVALPGGKMDADDVDEIQTALREAEEEIGLAPSNVDVIGIYSPGIVRPNYLVYPVLGLLKTDFTPVINEREVSLVFELPLKRFLDEENHFTTPFGSPVTYFVHHFHDTINGEKVDTFGFTASLCIYVALGVYQTGQSFKIYTDYAVTKDNLFMSPMTVKEMITNFVKNMGQSSKL